MLRKYLFLLLVSFTSLAGCEVEEDDYPSPSGGSGGGNGGGNGGGSSYKGTWVRLPGPSGDRTDLAIGNIPGEPSSRVYMCEKKGSTAAGFYKGTISGSTIEWDAVHNLPEFTVSMDGSELILDCGPCLPTPYKSGAWSGECGPLEGGSTGGNNEGQIMFWTRSDQNCGSISVSIANKSGTISSYYSSGSPSCGASGCATFTLPAGSYTYTASCSNTTWGPTTVTVTKGGCFKMELQ